MQITNNKIKKTLSIVSFIASIILGFVALFIPPTGIIDSSVLFFTAQLLCFTAAMLGVDLNINHNGNKISTQKDNKHRDED